MPKKLIFSATLMLASALVLMISMTSVSYAQLSTPTPIPVLPDATEDSAAPGLPDIAPPAVDTNTTSDSGTLATEVPGDSTTADTGTGNNGDVCPANISDSFTAAEILCGDVTSGEACVGNGTVETNFASGAEGTFAQANDRADVSSLERVALTSSGTWTVIRADINLPTSDGGDSVPARTYAYGNVTITETGEVATGGARSGTIIAGGGLNVRRTPGNDGVLVWQLSSGQQIQVTGITADRQWIRIVIPNEFAGTGWVYSLYVEVAGGKDTLAVVNENSPQPNLSAPQFGPGESFEISTELTPDTCSGNIPVSGWLMQSPSGTPDNLKVEINSATVEFNGTIFIQALAGESLNIYVLEGSASARANSISATATTNNRIRVPMDINLVVNGSPVSEAFSASDLPAVPTRLLQRQVTFGESSSASSDTTTTESTTTTTDTSTSTTTNSTTTTASDQTLVSASLTCTLTAPDVRNVRAGAATAFDVVQVLQPGETTRAVGQTIGESNLTWYQTENGGWIRIDTIQPTVDCASLPVVESPALPEPTEAPALAQGLQASTLAELSCDGSVITGTATSDGTDTSLAIGGVWTATAGTTATFSTQGGLLRPEFGDHIRLIAEDGSTIAQSGEGLTLTHTFASDTTFSARFSAANGDNVLIAASCS